MKRQQSNRSVLLLMEIIIAILFFSVVSAICLQLFVKSHNLSRSTEALDFAITQTSSVAEVIRSSDKTEDSLQQFFPELTKKADCFYLYYDEAFSYCKESAAVYCLKVTPSEKAPDNFEITMYETDKSKEIYRLEISTCQQKKL